MLEDILESNKTLALLIGSENKRKNYVKVTSKGAKIAKEVMDYDEQWDKICSENLSEKEFEEFKTTLKKIYSTIVKREEK